ncbi:MAG TPA: prepilin peptidase [Bacillota bacterium]|nr:prepilin peptidase [Bacillota bacterium]HQC35727.1 prepilin peptidase [Bacillota bacterium]
MNSIYESHALARVYIIIVSFVLGLAMGSFCNAWAFRMTSGGSITKGRSRCAKCGHELAAKDLVPLLSFLFLQGRCRYCREKIAPLYFAAELVSGIYYLSVVWVYGLGLTALRLLMLGSLVLVMSIVDLDTMELPDSLMLASALLSLIRLAENPANWLSMLTGLAPALALLVLVLIMDRLLKKESMGGGDIKLLAVFGLHLGAANCVLLLIVASLLGLASSALLRRKKGTPFPFGPFLAVAAWFAAIFGKDIIDAYLSFF